MTDEERQRFARRLRERDAEIERLRTALEDAIAWHEAERGIEPGESPRIDGWRAAALKDTTP